MIKRELDSMEVMHEMSVIMYKQGQMISFSSIMMIVIAIFCVSFSIVATYRSNDVVLLVVDIILLFANIFMLITTIKRMIERRSDMKEEQELYEAARQELLELEKKLEVES